MQIKIDIYSGFLGAGKTMLMKKLIEDKVYEDNIAIIENEFGEVSIDGAILRNTNIEVTEINSGCICCQVTGDFKKAILEVIDKYNPERILIEPSGVAKLTEVMDIFKEEDLCNKTIVDNILTVVDSERFEDYINNFGEFYTDQIKNSKKVVLSRSQNMNINDLSSLENKIKRLNPKATIVKESWENINGKDIIEIKEKIKLNIKETVVGRIRLKKDTDSRKSESNGFESFAVYLDRKVSEEELVSKFNFISSCNSYGEVVRAKGIVVLLDGEKGQFDFVKNEFELRTIEHDSNSVISFIGRNLNKSELGKMFK